MQFSLGQQLNLEPPTEHGHSAADRSLSHFTMHRGRQGDSGDDLILLTTEQLTLTSTRTGPISDAHLSSPV